MRKKVRRLESLTRRKFDVVWSFDNSVFFDFGAFGDRVLKISHIVDLNQDFQTRRAASTADYCFCTTDLLLERLTKFNRNAFKIHHGYHLGETENFTLASPSMTTVVYAGNLSMPYVDWVVLQKLVKANPDVEFVFIGPNVNVYVGRSVDRDAKREVVESRNVRFIGVVPADELQRYYRSADVLLVAYKEETHPEQANPHKMMEYLGSGTVILATDTLEYRHMAKDGLMVMANRNDELPNLFAGMLDQLADLNGERLRRARKEFAMDNTYDRQIDRIQRIINDYS